MIKYVSSGKGGSVLLGLLLSVCIIGCGSSTDSARLYVEGEHPQIMFAVEEIKSACAAKGIAFELANEKDANILISVSDESNTSKGESFSLEREDEKIFIEGGDVAGAMYGGIELAEQIEISGLAGVQEKEVDPCMELRGTKFNIPLDVRTPSYTDASDVAQKNMPEMWNYDFWTEYIDNMARYRYNFISLWSLHPFPSMVKVPGFEDIALDDVRRSTGAWEEYHHTWAIGLDAPEIVDNYEVLKKITMDEKIEFWKKVMQYAKSRNVTFYIITWNIFVNGTKGKYGITDKVDNLVTRDYFKQSVKAMFRTYPDLGGIGLTTGENMHGIAFDDKEDWAFDAYAQGVLEIADEMPERDFTFIHRQHMAGAREIADRFKEVIEKKNIEFIYSFKYAKAHVFSATRQPYHEDFAKEIGDLKTIWTLRNDDAYYFRWGSPDFVREFIQNIPHQISRGIYYGSDQWIWGREFTTKNASEPRQLEVVKHWYHWLLWGRLSYDPTMSNERFVGLLQAKFPETDAQVLFDAWHEASMVYPVTTGFHWGTIDIKWYIEGCRSRPNFANNESGFHDVNTFIEQPVHDYCGCTTIPDYVNAVVNDKSIDLKTPFDIAQLLHSHADKAFSLLEELENDENGQELKYTLHDIRTMAHMGKYYAYKIAGSTNVAMFRSTKDKKFQEEAVAQLTQALTAWEAYTDAAMEQNINPIWTNRVGHVDWVKTTELVKKDIDIAREPAPEVDL